ncbi:MAG: hypothetical protein ACLSHC_00275 [Bilophila wadsworthia]
MSQITSPQYRGLSSSPRCFHVGPVLRAIDVLNKHFQVTLNVSKAQSGLIQAATSGPISSAIPAACSWNEKATRRHPGGLSLYAIGPAFVPAAGVAAHVLPVRPVRHRARVAHPGTAAKLYLGARFHGNRRTRLNLSQSLTGLGNSPGRCSGGCCSSAATRPAAEAGLMPSG